MYKSRLHTGQSFKTMLHGTSDKDDIVYALITHELKLNNYTNEDVRRTMQSIPG